MGIPGFFFISPVHGRSEFHCGGGRNTKSSSFKNTRQTTALSACVFCILQVNVKTWSVLLNSFKN